MLKTKCAVCGEYLIEGGESETDNVGELQVNLSCPKCGAEVIYIIQEPQLTNYGCVDCDSCSHRSENCLCDISDNDENCPLIKIKGE